MVPIKIWEIKCWPPTKFLVGDPTPLQSKICNATSKMIKKNDNIEYIDNIVRQNLEHRNKVPIGIAIEMVARLRFLFFSDHRRNPLDCLWLFARVSGSARTIERTE